MSYAFLSTYNRVYDTGMKLCKTIYRFIAFSCACYHDQADLKPSSKRPLKSFFFIKLRYWISHHNNGRTTSRKNCWSVPHSTRQLCAANGWWKGVPILSNEETSKKRERENIYYTLFLLYIIIILIPIILLPLFSFFRGCSLYILDWKRPSYIGGKGKTPLDAMPKRVDNAAAQIKSALYGILRWFFKLRIRHPRYEIDNNINHRSSIF